jgi:hypothetical protein
MNGYFYIAQTLFSLPYLAELSEHSSRSPKSLPLYFWISPYEPQSAANPIPELGSFF